MPQINVSSFNVHRSTMRKSFPRTKSTSMKSIHIKIRPSRQNSIRPLTNSITDTSQRMFNDSPMSQTTLDQLETCSTNAKNDPSFKYEQTWNERSSSQQTKKNPFEIDTNIERFSKYRTKKKHRSRKRGACCTPTRCCLCLPILTALILSALALIITTSVLASLRTKNPDTTTTIMSAITSSSTSSTPFISTTASVTTNITSTSTATATSTSSTTTTTTGITLLTTTNETVYALWNTSAGQDSTPSTNGTDIGNFYPTEMPDNVFDNTTATKYTNFGYCFSNSSFSSICGVNTGLYVTPQRGPSSLVMIQFCTANSFPDRDPLTVTIEGSNQPSSSLTLGSSWTLIYNGSTGLQSITIRFQCGPVLSVSNNSNWYSSYRILVTSIRSVEKATQYSELRLMGYQ